MPATSSQDVPASRGPKALLVEGDLLVEQVIDSPAELGGEDAERLALAALLLLALEPLLGPLALAQQETRCLRKGPAQVRITDLLTAAAQLLAARLVGAADQAGVAEEVADLRKPADVVDLVEQHQSEDLADAGDRTQPMERVDVVHLGGAGQVQFDVAQERVVLVDE